MFQKTLYAAAIGFILLAFVATPGCFTGLPVMQPGVTLGLLTVPIPVSPYLQDQMEDKFWEKERYAKVPVLGPISAGGPAIAMDPPSDDEVMRALESARPLEGGVPMLHEIQRSNVRIVKELIQDMVDPPRDYPLIGPAQLHHCHYKCTVYFTETTRVGWPVPYTTTNEEAQEVLYIDHNHFHIVGNVDPGPGSPY